MRHTYSRWDGTQRGFEPDAYEILAAIPALARPVDTLTGGDDTPPAVAAAVAFILEGMHLSKRLNKDVSERRAVYRAR